MNDDRGKIGITLVAMVNMLLGKDVLSDYLENSLLLLKESFTNGRLNKIEAIRLVRGLVTPTLCLVESKRIVDSWEDTEVKVSRELTFFEGGNETAKAIAKYIRANMDDVVYDIDHYIK
jgi:ribosomal protein L7/L12